MASIEHGLYEFILAAVTADALTGNPLDGAEVDEATFADVTAAFGVRIGDSHYRLAPNSGQTDMTEFDAIVDVIIFAVVSNGIFNKAQARDKVKAIVRELALLFVNDPSIGGIVRESRFLDAAVGWDSNKTGTNYCIASMPFIYNETGQQLPAGLVGY